MNPTRIFNHGVKTIRHLSSGDDRHGYKLELEICTDNGTALEVCLYAEHGSVLESEIKENLQAKGVPTA